MNKKRIIIVIAILVGLFLLVALVKMYVENRVEKELTRMERYNQINSVDFTNVTLRIFGPDIIINDLEINTTYGTFKSREVKILKLIFDTYPPEKLSFELNGINYVINDANRETLINTLPILPKIESRTLTLKGKAGYNPETSKLTVGSLFLKVDGHVASFEGSFQINHAGSILNMANSKLLNLSVTLADDYFSDYFVENFAMKYGKKKEAALDYLTGRIATFRKDYKSDIPQTVLNQIISNMKNGDSVKLRFDSFTNKNIKDMFALIIDPDTLLGEANPDLKN